MAEADHQLKLVFLPFLSTSHIIPVVGTARIFAIFSVDVTIIAIPANAVICQKSIDRHSSEPTLSNSHSLRWIFLKASKPSMPILLATGVQNLPGNIDLIKDHFEQLFQDYQADCIVTDMFLPWSVETAAKLNIPWLIFLGGTSLMLLMMPSRSTSLTRK
ncbi:hypothetical protein QN277_003264 [Acacia crassicarpa]|uniref:Uncharacterized protein n=1 Tax=Acacia crassicarpa TaxID=499986 RepID=A0AAE1IY28_9FABA|nr:hypothetical protein QN277_003264 [Acacia crassicarpa]